MFVALAMREGMMFVARQTRDEERRSWRLEFLPRDSILTLPSQLFRVFPIREHDLATTGTEQYLDTGTGFCYYVLMYRAFHSMLKQGFVMG